MSQTMSLQILYYAEKVQPAPSLFTNPLWWFREAILIWIALGFRLAKLISPVYWTVFQNHLLFHISYYLSAEVIRLSFAAVVDSQQSKHKTGSFNLLDAAAKYKQCPFKEIQYAWAFRSTSWCHFHVLPLSSFHCWQSLSSGSMLLWSCHCLWRDQVPFLNFE